MIKNQNSIKSYRVNIRFFSQTPSACSPFPCPKRRFLFYISLHFFIPMQTYFFLFFLSYIRDNKLYTFFCAFFFLQCDLFILTKQYRKRFLWIFPFILQIHSILLCCWPSLIRSQMMDTWIISNLPRQTMLPWLNLGICHFAHVQVDL